MTLRRRKSTTDLTLRVLVALIALLSLRAGHAQALHGRRVASWERDWRFLAAEATHAEAPGFDDRQWSTVDVPHDWSIAGPVAKTNATGQGGGYFPNGIGWYRRTFSLPQADAGRHVFIVFDGVMANSEVWINGTSLGKRPNGSVSFYYELTGHLQFGGNARNVLTVRCDNAQQPASRWYEGAGIYRPVRLVVTQDIYLEPWSTFVSTPVISGEKATVRVQANVLNDSPAAAKAGLTITLIGPDGSTVAVKEVAPSQTIGKAGKGYFAVDIPVVAPKLWDIDHPALYKAIVQVRAGVGIVDEEQLQFGIREFHFDPDKGFFLNGRGFKLKGVALHIDGGGVGIAVPTAVYEHRLLALRALGVNAIRTAHNPPSPEFLDLCDRLGFLVMEEMFDCWTVGKNPYDYHLVFDEWSSRDTRDTVKRDRNHPSIILWSAGNEIHDTPNAELAKKILARLVKDFHETDPTRPVTQGLFRPNVSHDYDDGLADMLDVVGQNYRPNEILAAHDSKPSRKIVGTENIHDLGTWLAMRDHPAYSGQFLWTGIDYLGEAKEAGDWPLIGNAAGLLDRTAFPRARGLERQSWWSDTPNVHIVRRVAPSAQLNADPGYAAAPERFKQALFPDWTPDDPKPHTEQVEVYTNCEEVDLLLNGTSLGRQKLHADASPLTWEVPYTAGSLKAVAYDHGRPAAQDELRTAARPTHLVLTAERKTVSPDRNDSLYLIAELQDEAGVRISDSSTTVYFTVSGPAKIVAVDSGSNSDHDSFALPQRKLYQGRAAVLIRATAGRGAIQVTASANGFASDTTSVAAIPAATSAFIRTF